MFTQKCNIICKYKIAIHLNHCNNIAITSYSTVNPHRSAYSKLKKS